MGTQGLYLNRWTPDFDPEVDVPKEVPVWVRLPNLPVHCWNIQTLEKFGNALGIYIDKAENKGQYSCARICVEVDLEAGLPEAVKLKVGTWHHYQKLDYEQLPFKCHHCHEHNHFQRNCPKIQIQEEGEGWQKVKKGKMDSKAQEKKTSGDMQKNNQPPSSNNPPQEATKEAPIVIQDAEEPQKVSDPAGKDPVSVSIEEIQTENHPSSKEVESQAVDPLEPGEIPHSNRVVSAVADTSGPSKDTNEDPLLLETDPGEDMDDGASSSSLHAVPFKNPRGRKSKNKKREEATYLAVLEGSQKTLKGMMHT